MTFCKLLKCAFCLRWNCSVRYQVGNRTFLSGLGFVSKECPKKLEKDPFYQYTKRMNRKITEERLKQVNETNDVHAKRNK